MNKITLPDVVLPIDGPLEEIFQGGIPPRKDDTSRVRRLS